MEGYGRRRRRREKRGEAVEGVKTRTGGDEKRDEMAGKVKERNEKRLKTRRSQREGQGKGVKRSQKEG